MTLDKVIDNACLGFLKKEDLIIGVKLKIFIALRLKNMSYIIKNHVRIHSAVRLYSRSQVGPCIMDCIKLELNTISLYTNNDSYCRQFIYGILLLFIKVFKLN